MWAPRKGAPQDFKNRMVKRSQPYPAQPGPCRTDDSESEYDRKDRAGDYDSEHECVPLLERVRDYVTNIRMSVSDRSCSYTDPLNLIFVF